MSATVLPYVAGSRSAPGGGETFELVNPATGEAFAEVAASDEAQVDDAVAAAREAQRTWAKLGPERRGELLWAWGDLVRDHAEELGRADTMSMGCPLRYVAEAPSIANRVRYGWYGRQDPRQADPDRARPPLRFTVRGLPAAWPGTDRPLERADGPLRRPPVSVALACGNGVVLKPSELSPVSALRIRPS